MKKHISKKKWKSYVPNSKIGWLSFLLLISLMVTTILGSIVVLL